MEFVKTVISNRKLISQLGKNDFKNKFAGTTLGAIWGFIQPFIFMMTYVIVFQYILKVSDGTDIPYIVWFLPGMSMWMFLNDGIISASNSIRGYSYLVKKVVFPVDVIPIITLVSSSIIGLFLVIVSCIVCTAFGYFPNILMLIYYVLAAYIFIISLTRLTSAITTLVPDFSQLLNISMQLFLWFTPILWNITRLDGPILTIVKCSPFAYLVQGFREAFTGDSFLITEQYGAFTAIFWLITILIYFWGNYVFKKSRKDFADVL